MRTLSILTLLAIALTGCTARHLSSQPNTANLKAAESVTPVGTFVGEVMQVKLDPDGTYVAEDIGPPEYWTMVEGTTPYPQRIKFPPQKGRWTWNPETGELRLKSESGKFFRWGLEDLRFDRAHPNRLAWGNYAFLNRKEG